MTTQRTKADLLTLCANNTTGAITPQTLRDIIESCTPSRGALHFADTVTPTTILGAGQYAKAANTGVLIEAYRFSMPSIGRLQYDGVASIWAALGLTLSVSLASGSGDVIQTAIAINDAVYVPSIMRTKLAATGDVQALSMVVDVVLDPGDYIELFLLNESTGADILVSHGYMTALGFLT